MDLERLTTLKHKLVTADNFRETWEYFFEHFGGNPHFLKMGNRVTNPLLEAIVTKMSQELFQQSSHINQLLLTEIEAYHFIHGACLLEDHIVTILFFTDIDMGLFAISMEELEISLIRFSSMKIEINNNTFLSPFMSHAIN
ncbi:MAG: hypothetical protein HC877_21885 [Thioploca sp.]|nr:hypothetical protein [Thioploca sp.]